MNEPIEASGAAPLEPSRLRWTCQADAHPALFADDAVDRRHTVGQERAVAALSLGLEMGSPGYNIFVTGVMGTGRTRTLEALLDDLDQPHRARRDLAYVHNFEEPIRPILVSFPPGRGRAFKSAMHDLIARAKTDVQKTLEADSFAQRATELTEALVAREKALFKELDEAVRRDALALVQVHNGPMIVQAIMPLVEGEPKPFDALRNAPPEGWDAERIDALEKKAEGHKKSFEAALKEGRRLKNEAIEKVRAFRSGVVRQAIEGLVEDVEQDFADEKVAAYLQQVLDHLCEDPAIVGGSDDDEDDELSTLLGELHGGGAQSPYGVNVVLEAPVEGRAPVVIERHPSFTNLFGTVERERVEDGGVSTSFMRIRAGSFLRAQGGFLVMYAADVLGEPGVWRTLARVLRSRQLEIQTPDTALYLLPSALKPEPIATDVKLILIGDETTYQLLSHYEDDFPKIFKVKAEFDATIPREPEGIDRFARVVRGVQRQEGLLPLEPLALARLVEEAVRRAGRNDRLTSRFGEVADMVREASFFQRRLDPEAERVGIGAVDAALEAARARSDLIDRKLHKAIQDGTVLIDTSGLRVGQINGLAVYGIGRHGFGKPTRITASCGPGRGGLVNVEREAELSGPTHDKGVLILSGHLRQRYGQERPLALSASLAFEQSYGGVDGDSASLAELYALLSAISGLPIRQSVAITGSMNQLGDAQPIGGVNEKIEGFFRLCRDRGLDGTHGVVIPTANVEGLMLDRALVEAASAGRFHVWAVERVDDAVPILFGVSARTLDARVRRRLAALWEASRDEGPKSRGAGKKRGKKAKKDGGRKKGR